MLDEKEDAAPEYRREYSMRGATPFGFRKETGRGAGIRFVPVPAERKIIHRMQTLRNEGRSLRIISGMIEEEYGLKFSIERINLCLIREKKLRDAQKAKESASKASAAGIGNRPVAG